MNMTIWKYDLDVQDRAEILMKKNATILHVGNQKPRVITIWALVDKNEKDIQRFFTILGTGNPANHLREHQKFLGTVMDYPFVWHVWTD